MSRDQRVDSEQTSTRTTTLSIYTVVATLILALALLWSVTTYSTLGLGLRRSATSLFSPAASYLRSKPVREIMIQTSPPQARGDVYFISHGGPPTVEQYDSEPYLAWRKFGDLVRANKPKGIVAVSAHWENDEVLGSDHRGWDVKVNSDPSNPLIYDFYNFPKRMYELTFTSSGGDGTLKSDIVSALKQGGMRVKEEKRGPDHGVWIPFLAAFGKSTDIPIVQVSLPTGPDPVASLKLGATLAPLRDQGYAIVATGQAMHNIRDAITGVPMPYTRPFLDAVSSALTSPAPCQPALDLFQNPLFKRAHPTDEHFLPILVAAAAVHAGVEKKDTVEEIYTGVVGIGGVNVAPNDGKGLGWGMWRWSQAAS